MTQDEEIEEIMLAILRSSKKVKLAKINIEELDVSKKRYTLTIDVDKDFGLTLMKALENPFSKLFSNT